MRIIPYTPHLEGQFHSLWVNWLRDTTGAEPQEEDMTAVNHPEQFYIDSGGAVFFAMLKAHPVGVVAVKNLGVGNYEFCKLVVTREARGMGLGKMLVVRCIEFVGEQNGHALYLQSFRKLEVALKMYEKMGFKHAEAPTGMSVLSRTEIIMKMAGDTLGIEA